MQNGKWDDNHVPEAMHDEVTIHAGTHTPSSSGAELKL
jgi:hypothetical protein